MSGNAQHTPSTASAVPSDSGRSKVGRLHRLTHWMIQSDSMLWGIGLASFLEAIIVPIPLETILIPLMQARRRQLLLISLVALIGCLLAAVLGYAIGYYLFEAVGYQFVELVSTQEQYETVRSQMDSKGFWLVFGIGLVPVPFQVAMLAAGGTKYSLWLFLVASTLARGIRYFGLGLLVYYTGNRAQRLFERHKRSTSIALLIIVAIIWSIALFG